MQCPNPLNIKPWLEAAEELIRFDEPERALKILELVPAHYRDFEDDQIRVLKADILRAMITAHAYRTSGLDQNVSEGQAEVNITGLLRGRIILEEMRKLTNPHIVDVGPGEYWVPIGLLKAGHTFTYNPVSMDEEAAAQAEPLIKGVLQYEPQDRPTMFIAHEIIEHLPSTQDLPIEALRHCGKWPEYVHLSTPLYCFDNRPKEWNKLCGLPHLRAYTPREFIAEAQKLFPGYNWEYRTDYVQSVRGYRVGGAILNDLR